VLEVAFILKWLFPFLLSRYLRAVWSVLRGNYSNYLVEKKKGGGMVTERSGSGRTEELVGNGFRAFTHPGTGAD